MSKFDLKETVNSPRSPDEHAFWMYHVGNTQRWNHPLGNEDSFSPEADTASRRADNTLLDDRLPTPFINDADWVDELMSDMKNVMRHYYAPGYPGEFDPKDVSDDGYYDEVLGEDVKDSVKNLWSFWVESAPTDIASKVRNASKEALQEMVTGIYPGDAKRVMSGPALVEFNYAVKRLEKLKGEKE